MAAGADLQLVYRVEVKTADDITLGLSLPRDLHNLDLAAQQTGAVLLILDPLMSRISEALDTHRYGDVGRALEPLVRIADHTGMATVGLIHHNKSAASTRCSW
jgi:AAA domain